MIEQKQSPYKQIEGSFYGRNPSDSPRFGAAIRSLRDMLNDTLKSFGVKALTMDDLPSQVVASATEIAILIYPERTPVNDPRRTATTFGIVHDVTQHVALYALLGPETQAVSEQLDRAADIYEQVMRAISANALLPDENAKSQLLWPMQLAGGQLETKQFGKARWRVCHMSVDLHLQYSMEGPLNVRVQ